jgi:hypothetical protein
MSVAGLSLLVLAICDMKNYHVIHITATIVFFLLAWVGVYASQLIRGILHSSYSHKVLAARSSKLPSFTLTQRY